MSKSFVAAFGRHGWLGLVGVVAALTGARCASREDVGRTSVAQSSSSDVCVPCVTDDDCSGGVCGQFQGDIFCAVACPNRDECSPTSTCSVEATYDGRKVSLCVPNGNACGASPSPADTTSDDAQAQPAADGGALSIDAGGPVTGTVGGDGGTVSRLLFSVVGDTRPPGIDDTSAYPTAIIEQIYSDIEALDPRPPFSLSTGDYMFARSTGNQAAPQLNLYMSARSKFSGAFFPALGNHECTGAAASNCGPGNVDGTTPNYQSFLSMLLGPIQQTSPYYSIEIDAEDGSWTSKFVFIAANAWDAVQATWLSGVMARPTTYTFVVRHEATGTSGPPGVKPSDAIINGFPYTLLIVGHTHTYEHKTTREVVFGNGGAPLTGLVNYGYGLISQRSDGAITVDEIDYQSGQADASFHFALTPTGSLTQ